MNAILGHPSIPYILSGIFAANLGLLYTAYLYYLSKVEFKRPGLYRKQKNKSLEQLEILLENNVEKEAMRVKREELSRVALGKDLNGILKFRSSVVFILTHALRYNKAFTVGVMSVVIALTAFLLIPAIITTNYVEYLLEVACILATALLVLVAMVSHHKVGIIQNALDFINLNVSTYMNTATFEQSIEKNLDSLPRKSPYYKAIRNLSTRLHDLSYDRDMSIDKFKSEMGNIEELDLYLDIVKKVETDSEEMKLSLQGISEILQPKLALYKDFHVGTLFVVCIYLISFTILYGGGFAKMIFTDAFSIDSFSALGVFCLFCYAIYAVIGFFMTTLISIAIKDI